MAEMPDIDPNFEPQSRPRSGTWPLNRPNIPNRRNRMPDMGTGSILSATLEEANSQELIADSGMLLDTTPMKDDYLSMLSPDSMLNQSDLDSMLMPPAPSANLVEGFPLQGGMAKQQPTSNGNILGNYCTTTTITELTNLNENQNFDEAQNVPCQTPSTSANFSPGGSNVPLSKSPTSSTTVSTTPSTSSSSTGATPKAKSTRKNAWGNMSYADLITQAIESPPDKRLTLAQIYEWMVKNVPYFKDKGDSNSSAGWKNSIRHNLSLHAKFKRIQNEGTGKSSWWVINHDAKPGKPARRRAISMDNNNQKYNRSRNKVIAKQKAELLKKQKSGLKAGETATWVRDSTSGLETTVTKALGSEYRQRASSNASSIGGRISPSHLYPPQDLEDDGAPPISPLGSAPNLANLSTSLPSAFDTSFFTVVRPDNTASTIPENNETLHGDLLNSLANMDVVSPPVQYGDQQVDSKSGIFLQQMNDVQQTPNRKNPGNNVAQNSPNLASLLQGNTKSTPKKSAQTTITKREPDWNESKTPFGFDYQTQSMMTQVMQSPTQYKQQIGYLTPNRNMQQSTQYSQQGQLQQQQPQVNFIQQQQQRQQVEMQQYMATQQRQPQMVPMDNQQPPPQYPGQESNLSQMGSGKFPSDIDLDVELFNPGDLDMAEMLRDIPQGNDSYNFATLDFPGKAENFYQQMRMQEQSDYNMGMNGNNGSLQQQQQQTQPVLHPNPDMFIANPGPGTTSMDLMMEGCRMNKASNFQHMQSGQTSSVGAGSSYPMQ